MKISNPLLVVLMVLVALARKGQAQMVTRAQTAAAAAAAAVPHVAHTVEVAGAYVNWDAMKGVFTFAAAGVAPQNVVVVGAVAVGAAVTARYHKQIETYSRDAYGNVKDSLPQWLQVTFDNTVGLGAHHHRPPTPGLNDFDTPAAAPSNKSASPSPTPPQRTPSPTPHREEEASSSPATPTPSGTADVPAQELSLSSLQIEIQNLRKENHVLEKTVADNMDFGKAQVDYAIDNQNYMFLYSFWFTVIVVGILMKRSLDMERDIVALQRAGNNNTGGAAGRHLGGMVPGQHGAAANPPPPPLAGHGGTGGAGAGGGNNNTGNNGGGQAPPPNP